jgi:hypothetical protein
MTTVRAVLATILIPPYSHSAASMPRGAASGGKRTLSGGTKRYLEGHGFR